MTGARARSKARKTFTVTDVEVTAYADVDLDEDDLREAGWVYVGAEVSSAALPEGGLARVERWHDDQHTGPMVWCTHELCFDLVRMAHA